MQLNSFMAELCHSLNFYIPKQKTFLNSRMKKYYKLNIKEKKSINKIKLKSHF